MNKASPVELRKAIVLSNELVKAGIDFVPIPVKDSAHKIELHSQLNDILDYVEKKAEK